VSWCSLVIFLRRAGRGAPGAARPALSWAALRRELADGIRYLTATRVLFGLLIFVLVLNLCLGADKLIIFMAKDTLRLPAWQVGLVISAGGAGGILGAAGASWWSGGSAGSRWWSGRAAG
jgi:hypothetical protein